MISPPKRPIRKVRRDRGLPRARPADKLNFSAATCRGNGIGCVSMIKARFWIAGCLAGLLLLGAARADDAADTRQQAVWLLKKSTLVHRNGRHNLLLRALRQMRDPTLEPLYSELIQRRHPGLKIHGILGLAELKNPPRLDLALVADIDSSGTQAQLVSAAIDNNLLTAEDAEKLAEWPGLSPAVKVLVAGKLVAEGKSVPPGLLDEAMGAEKLAMRAMAALLKAHVGDAEARAALDAVHEAEGAERDMVRKLVLQMAMRHELASVGPWAAAILREGAEDEQLVFAALRAALMFQTDGAAALWRERFEAAGGLPMRLRLAVLAADVAEHVKPDLFIPLIRREQPLLATLGRAGETIAEGPAAAEPTIALIRMNNVLTNRWALKHAVGLTQDEDRDPAAARPILLALIDAADNDYLETAGERDQPRFAAQRLQSAIVAVQTLHHKAPAAHPAIRRRLNDATMLQQEAILMGLIRSEGDRPDRLLADAAPRYKSKTAEALDVLLRAKHADDAADLGERAMRRLSLIVRRAFPPGGLEDPLRIQAGWAYLRLSNDAQLALAEVLGGGKPRP